MSKDVKQVMQEKQIESKAGQLKQKQATEKKEFTKEAKAEVMGTYKRTIIDSYLNVFTENYGDTFDYNSLINSLNFKMESPRPDDLRPVVTCDIKKIEFDNSQQENFQNFNENTTPIFTKTNTVIDPDFIDERTFNSRNEYLAYEDSGNSYNNLIDTEGMFIPTSAGERYGKFNRINKQKGYMSRNESSHKAEEKAKNIWDNMKNKLFSNVIKKFGKKK